MSSLIENAQISACLTNYCDTSKPSVIQKLLKVMFLLPKASGCCHRAIVHFNNLSDSRIFSSPSQEQPRTAAILRSIGPRSLQLINFSFRRNPNFHGREHIFLTAPINIAFQRPALHPDRSISGSRPGAFSPTSILIHGRAKRPRFNQGGSCIPLTYAAGVTCTVNLDTKPRDRFFMWD